MFILCPHCQFLVAMDPASGLPPARCPRCGKTLGSPSPGAAAPPVQAPSAEQRAAGASAAPPQAAQPAPAEPAGDVADAVAASPGAPAADVVPREAPATRPAAERAPNGSRKRANGQPAQRREAAPPVDEAPAAADARATPPAPEPPAIPSASAAPAAPRPARRKAIKAPVPATPASVPSDADRDLGSVASDAAHHEAATVVADRGADQADAAATMAPDPLPQPVATPQASPAPVATQRRAPSFARATLTRTRRPRLRLPAAIAGLALLLALQVLLADRAALAADARWRPLVSALCGALRCSLPAWHEPGAITLLARDVRPTQPGVLHVSASFRNDARWPQAWPMLHLALQDVDGRTVGARTLSPREYLGHAPMTQNGLATGQVANVAFDIAEPGTTVVAFTFDFR